MIEELATVVAIKSNQVIVTSQIKSSCSSCSQVDTCGSGQVAKALPKAKLTVSLPYEGNILGQKLKEGDCVIIALPEKQVLSSAAQVYLLPLFGLILFSAIGQWLFTLQVLPTELVALLVGICGGYLGYRLASFLQKQGKHSASLQPKILKVLPASSNPH